MTSPNRGPAAAADNRAALLAAARTLFSEQGYAVPLSLIAKAAGVGQGTLYRHFPSREALGAAVLEDTMATLTRLADDGDPAAFHRLWGHIIATLADSVGFLDAVLGPRGELGEWVPSDDLASLLATPLTRAQAAGTVDGGITVDDLMLVLAMVHGATQRVSEPGARRIAANRALELIGGGLQPS